MVANLTGEMSAIGGQPTHATDERESLFRVEGLVVEFKGGDGAVRAVDNLNYHVNAGETLAVVGESGSGKSTAALASTGLIPPRSLHRVDGHVWFRGEDLLRLSKEDLRSRLGRDISMVFQDPMSSLNPVMRVGDQIVESLRTHDRTARDADKLRRRAIELLELVGVSQPVLRVEQYPHELSGGMRQRVMIAIAMANNPELLIADEPTTALDVTVQAQLLDVLRSVQTQTGCSILIISHDLNMVSEFADRVCVMYAGHAVETGPIQQVLYKPSHPYTAALLASRPRVSKGTGRLRSIPGEPPDLNALPTGCPFHPRCPLATEACRYVEPPASMRGNPHDGHLVACHHAELVPDLMSDEHRNFESAPHQAEPKLEPTVSMACTAVTLHYPVRSGVFGRQNGAIHAIDGLDLSIHRGETLGLVGESGCGKSTLARASVGLETLTSGTINLRDIQLPGASRREMRDMRRYVQVVFQDPYSSLNPAQSAAQNVVEPLRVHGVPKRVRIERARELFSAVGLSWSLGARRPAELSGGQQQRVGIARALSLRPEVLILDEPVSSLDVSVQAQVLNILRDLQQQNGLAYLFISHDLSVIRYMSDRVAVMYLAKIVEIATAEEVYTNPQHPYTQALLSAVSTPDRQPRQTNPRRIVLSGDIPDPAKPPAGCRFRTRCWKAQAICAEKEPPLQTHTEAGPDHQVACHFPGVPDRTGATNTLGVDG